jgi:hypothetical protein
MNSKMNFVLKKICLAGFAIIAGVFGTMFARAENVVVSVADFGLKPGTRENAVGAVKRALDVCRQKETNAATAGTVAGAPDTVTLVFPKGRYDFFPDGCERRDYYESNTTDNNPKRLAVFIFNHKNLVVDGRGSEFVFHDRMQPFTVDGGENITLKNFSIDWDIPLTAQAEVTRSADGFFDLKINTKESPFCIEKNRLVFIGEGWRSGWNGEMEFDGKTRRVVAGTGDSGCIRDVRGSHRRLEQIAPDTVRVYGKFRRQPAAGNLLVLRHNARDHAGIFITESKNTRVENVDMFHNAGLGVLAQYTDGLLFEKVRVVPNEKKGRILSGHDDAFQFSNCKGKVVVNGCEFHALMDDPINVHGTSVRVLKRINNNTLQCKFMHGQSVGMIWARAGDKVGFIENTSMQTIGTGVVKKFRALNKQIFEVEFECAVPEKIVAGNALENLTWTCDITVKNSFFKSCRARGILISTPGAVRIENNIFESSGSPILVAGDANYWYESGAVNDVVIRKNVFRSPCLTSMYQFCEAIISIDPVVPKLSAATPFHRNIKIIENEFHLFDYPVLFAKSVDGVEFSKNKLVRSHDFTPFHRRKDGLTFVACKNVTVHGNSAAGDILGRSVKLEKTDASECKINDGVFKF